MIVKLQIFMRDGLACALCGIGVESETRLTPMVCDYKRAQTRKNLITACERCSTMRGERPLKLFIAAVADYTDRTPACIEHHINECVKRPLPDVSSITNARLKDE